MASRLDRWIALLKKASSRVLKFHRIFRIRVRLIFWFIYPMFYDTAISKTSFDDHEMPSSHFHFTLPFDVHVPHFPGRVLAKHWICSSSVTVYNCVHGYMQNNFKICATPLPKRIGCERPYIIINIYFLLNGTTISNQWDQKGSCFHNGTRPFLN